MACQRRTFGQRCYLCEKVKELRATGDLTDKKKAKDIQAQKNVYMNIVDLKDKNTGVQVWRVGGFNQIMVYANDLKDYPDITDPKEGWDFKVDRTGTGLDTVYVNRARNRSTPIENMDWLKQLNDLDQFSRVEEYENQKSLYGYLFGEGSAPDSQSSETATEAEDDDEFDNKIEKDTGAHEEVVSIRTAYCIQMDKWGSFDGEEPNCRECTVKGECATATRSKAEAIKATGKDQPGEKLKKEMKDAAK